MLTLDELAASEIEDRAALLELAQEARTYLEAQPWCEAVESIRFGDGFENAAVFQAEALCDIPGAGTVWVVVGDLPPLQISTNGGAVATPAEALFIYTQRLIAWLYAARGEAYGGEIPKLVRRHSFEPVQPTPAMLDLIDRRIHLLTAAVIPWMLGEPDALSKRRPH